MGPDSHYLRMVDRVDALVHDDVDLSVRLQACPSWTAWEAVCHVAANVIDGSQGRIPETLPPSDEWTARQVADHRDRAVDEVVAAWRTATEALGPSIVDDLDIPLLLDAISHEHDVRGAVGRPGAQDDPAIPALLDMLARRWRGLLGDLPPLALDDGTTVRASGDGDPGLVLRASTFDLLRVLTGRRSQAQARAMVVDGDFDRYVDHLTLFAWPHADIDDG
jgi:hypothetical protein